MPVDLRNRSKKVQELRGKVREDLIRLVGYRCEITGKREKLDLHEFWVKLISQYKDDEVALILITHPANIIIIDNDFHIKNRPGIEICQPYIMRRSNRVWRYFGSIESYKELGYNFNNYLEAKQDFVRRIQNFYETGQIKVPVSYIPIAYVPKTLG